MSKEEAEGTRPSSAIGRLAWLIGAAVLGLLCTGCLTAKSSHKPVVVAARPLNVYRASAILPLEMRRVAVLPVTAKRGDWQADAGLPEVEPVLHTELGKTKAFELVFVTPAQLEHWTGQPSWTADQKLPENFFEKLREELGCDAVLFSALRPYHPYTPIAIGWGLKLVEVRHHSTVWAADEVFEEYGLAGAAQSYWDKRLVHTAGSGEGVLISPRRFNEYALSTLLSTIPPHQRVNRGGE